MTSMVISPDAQVEISRLQTTIAEVLAEFAVRYRADDIPAPVVERAKYLILDAVGNAYASTTFEFAHRSLSATIELSAAGGDMPVIGMSARLLPRDAMLLNGILVHGLDFDDTHAAGIIHATASCLPCSLGVSAQLDLDGRGLLSAYIIGVEAATRIGAVAKGGFHQVGFHPTGLVGTFACALIASRLLGLNTAETAMAQGIALSVAAGSLEFLQDGAWTKRLHPGWAAVAGQSAAVLARHGFVGPRAAYEGRFGLFASYLGHHAKDIDLGLATADLGTTWELSRVTVKPIPACHFTHACADAAATIRERHGLIVSDIRSVRALVPREVVKTVCEPASQKRRPQNGYEAQFSIPYIVATSLARGNFGLKHLDASALNDPEVLALAQKVDYEVDPDSPFPKYYSGEVIVSTTDGRVLRHREEINRGAAERPIENAEVERKFIDNATMAVSPARAAEIRDNVLSLDRAVSARGLAESLAELG